MDGFFAERPVGELVAGVRDGRWTAAELVERCLGALAAAHERTGCVASWDAVGARSTAARLDAGLARGEAVGPLHGVPFTAKDWLDAAGLPCTGGWARHRERRPERDAAAVARLRAAGAVLVAKTAPLAESELYGVVRNPHDPSRSPGASSSGEGAAVGAGASPLGLGSDSGGSVRLPAAWCGVAGLKPTAGRVPTTGHFPRVGPHGDGRTQVGPLVRHAADLELVLRVIQGPDGRDPGVAPVPLGAAASVDLAGLRVGWSAGEPGWEPHPAIAAAVRGSVDRLASLGARTVGEVVVGLDESLDVTERYWGRAGLSGEEVGRQLADWDRYARRSLRTFADVDAIVLPATRDLPPPVRPLTGADYVYTLPASLTGGPAAVAPAGSHDGLPVSVQVLAAPWRDDIAIAVAATLRP